MNWKSIKTFFDENFFLVLATVLFIALLIDGRNGYISCEIYSRPSTQPAFLSASPTLPARARDENRGVRP
jgi:hypothetical protein